MKYKVFIDGAEGTTGLKIHEYFAPCQDIEIINIEKNKKKDMEERLRKIKASDVSFLCLPDEASKEISKLVPREKLLIDTSTAHRTSEEWAYGLPELSKKQREKISKSTRVANPGCHATGFILLINPLIEEGIISKEIFISATSITGYSGGGKKMIENHKDHKEDFLKSPGAYGLKQEHKHLPEIMKMSGITTQPGFVPIVGDFYSGMVVTIPIHNSFIKNGERLAKVYMKRYEDSPMINVLEEMPKDGFIHGNIMSGKNNVQLFIIENKEVSLLVARYDNLGKGASGAAIQNMNIMLGREETKGLI